jgi:hypothetical protein
MSRLKMAFVAGAALMALAGGGCRKGVDDQGQIGASVGEVMASADDAANPAALAFSACADGVRTETFSSFPIGRATLDGSVTLTFSDRAGCLLAAPGDSVNRLADFTITAPAGGVLSVTSSGGGQTLTRTAAGFDFAVPGMERMLMGARGAALLDISSETTTPLTITGSSRDDLTIVSGTLVVTHHLAGYAVTLTPENLAWDGHCSCAVSGKLTGTVSGGSAAGDSATVTITGCGTADVDVGGDAEPVTLDRCVKS